MKQILLSFAIAIGLSGAVIYGCIRLDMYITQELEKTFDTGRFN